MSRHVFAVSACAQRSQCMFVRVSKASSRRTLLAAAGIALCLGLMD